MGRGPVQGGNYSRLARKLGNNVHPSSDQDRHANCALFPHATAEMTRQMIQQRKEGIKDLAIVAALSNRRACERHRPAPTVTVNYRNSLP